MSWIAGLAGKAENLLNNIDQSAAVVIKTPDSISVPNRTETKDVTAKSRISPAQRTHTDSTLNEHIPKTSKTATAKSDESTKYKPKTKSIASADEALFDFLNSGKKLSAHKSSPKSSAVFQKISKSRSSASIASATGLPGPENSGSKSSAEQTGLAPAPAAFHISRSSSIDSYNSKPVTVKLVNDNGSSSSEGVEPYSEGDLAIFPPDSSESEFELVSNAAVSSTAPSEHDWSEESPEVVDKGDITNLRMENRMLQNEITALHQELKSMAERNKRMKAEMERINYEIQRKLDEAQEQFKVRSSQVDAMRIQVHDYETQTASLKQNINEMKTEQKRILNDQTAGSGMHAQAMEQLRSRLEDAESSLIREKDSHRMLKEESLREREKQEDEMRKLVETLRKSERERQAEKRRLEDLIAETNTLQTNLSATKHELSDYKQKASRILQSKERLISSLKGGSDIDITASASASIELEELRQERDSLKDEVMTLRAECVQMRNEFQDVEGQYQQEQSVLQEEIEEVRRTLQEETDSRKDAEADIARNEQEMRREKEETTRARAAAHERLQDKQSEIEKLRSQLMIRSRSSPNESELESRLHQLTEALIQKQTLVETLSTEKSSLLLQLERSEGQIKRLSQETVTHMQAASDGGESAKSYRNTGYTNMFSFSSSGSERGVVGHVRKAASAVDRFSVRLGVFLRRYPTARLFVILYMGLLHLWVMIVLLTYKPEIHSHDFLDKLEKSDHGLPGGN